MKISTDVSVALCTYNGEAFIREQLESIFIQSMLPGQIIISDDGSSDATLKIISATLEQNLADRSALKEIDIRVVENPEPLGVTKNFEQALGMCNGDFIFLSDQDDLWHPQRIEEQRAALQAGADVVFGDADLVNEIGSSLSSRLFQTLGVSRKEITAITGENPYQVLLKRNIVTGATCAFRVAVLTQAFPFPSFWVHDEWIAMIASLTGKRFAVSQPLIDYRQHSANQIGASKVGLGQKISRVKALGIERNTRLLNRAQQLNIRVEDLGLPANIQLLAHEKLRHEMARSELSKNRIRRIPQVMREIVSGRYFTFGMGFQDIVRDFLQPL